MEDKPFGWCFLGTGTLANNVAKEILPSGRHRVVSSYSRNAQKNAAFAAQYGAYAAASAEEAITHPGVDGVYVVTPHPSHYALVKTALGCNKPVLCEKPFTMTAEQARELFALANQRGLYLAEAMWTWFAPTANRVKAWTDADRFGTIERVHLNYHMNGQNYAPRVTDPALAGGAILDIGVYPIHYLIRLFGKPTEVACTGRLKGGIDWGEEIDLTFSDGRKAHISMAIDDWKGLERLVIKGTQARTSIWFFHMANAAKLKKGLRTLDRIHAYGGMQNEFDLVAGEIRDGRKQSRFVPPDATIDTMAVVDACRRQMQLVYPFEQ